MQELVHQVLTRSLQNEFHRQNDSTSGHVEIAFVNSGHEENCRMEEEIKTSVENAAEETYEMQVSNRDDFTDAGHTKNNSMNNSVVGTDRQGICDKSSTLIDRSVVPLPSSNFQMEHSIVTEPETRAAEKFGNEHFLDPCESVLESIIQSIETFEETPENENDYLEETICPKSSDVEDLVRSLLDTVVAGKQQKTDNLLHCNSHNMIPSATIITEQQGADTNKTTEEIFLDVHVSEIVSEEMKSSGGEVGEQDLGNELGLHELVTDVNMVTDSFAEGMVVKTIESSKESGQKLNEDCGSESEGFSSEIPEDRDMGIKSEKRSQENSIEPLHPADDASQNGKTILADHSLRENDEDEEYIDIDIQLQDGNITLVQNRYDMLEEVDVEDELQRSLDETSRKNVHRRTSMQLARENLLLSNQVDSESDNGSFFSAHSDITITSDKSVTSYRTDNVDTESYYTADSRGMSPSKKSNSYCDLPRGGGSILSLASSASGYETPSSSRKSSGFHINFIDEVSNTLVSSKFLSTPSSLPSSPKKEDESVVGIPGMGKETTV